MEQRHVPPNRILLVPLGFTIWSIAFVALYATNAIGCVFGWPEIMQRSVLIVMTLGFLAIGAISWLLVYKHWRRRAKRESEPAPTLSILGVYGLGSAVVSMFGVFIPGLAMTMCI